jgi:hypothetical protein
MPLTGADAGFPAARAFRIAGIFSFDQQPADNTVVIASVISEIGGWLVVHAEANGQPGPVLGQTLLKPGTNAAVQVTLNADGLTPVVWPMLHVDDTTIGTYEFGTVENADLPIFLGDVTATRPMALTDAPTVLLADNTPLDNVTTVPAVSAAPQTFDTDPNSGLNFVVDNVISIGPGFVDVHTDDNGYPSGSLGHSPVLDGQNSGVSVLLMPQMNMPITPVVWPMLHQDTNANGTYDYLMIPGEDLPVVYNGAVVTIMATLSGSAVATMAPVGEMTAVPPTMDMGGTTTATATSPTAIPTASSEATSEATSETTPEATSDGTAEATADVTDEATVEVTPEMTVTLTATP